MKKIDLGQTITILANIGVIALAKAFEAARTEGWEGISPVEKRLVSGYIRTLFHNWSNAYCQYEDGTLDENQWQGYIREVRSGMSSPLLRQVWSEWGFVFDDKFRELINDFIAESESEAN